MPPLRGLLAKFSRVVAVKPAKNPFCETLVHPASMVPFAGGLPVTSVTLDGRIRSIIATVTRSERNASNDAFGAFRCSPHRETRCICRAGSTRRELSLMEKTKLDIAIPLAVFTVLPHWEKQPARGVLVPPL